MSLTTTANRPSNLFISLVSLSLLLTLITVILSAYIRLSVNGLGCTDWPDCYGRVSMAGQYQGIDVLTTKGATMKHNGVRIAHRLIASVLGVFIVFINIIVIRQRSHVSRPELIIPLLILGDTIFLSILGYITPSPLVPVVTLGNLLGGLLMLALLWWLSQGSVIDRKAHFPMTSHHVKPWVILGLVLLSLQIISGSWTSAAFAGPACPDLSSCPGTSWSFQDISLFAELPVDSQGKVIDNGSTKMIHLIHRIGAVAIALYLAWLALKITSHRDRLFNTAIAVIVLIVLQLGIGLLSIVTQLPLLLMTAHNAVAALLLLAMVNLLHLLSRPRQH